jgi:hypothetical protein
MEAFIIKSILDPVPVYSITLEAHAHHVLRLFHGKTTSRSLFAAAILLSGLLHSHFLQGTGTLGHL